MEKKQERLKVEGLKDAKLRKRLEDELEWVRSSPKARQAKSKSRLERYEEMASEADKTKKLDFEEIQIPPGPRLGNQVVEVKELSKVHPTFFSAKIGKLQEMVTEMYDKKTSPKEAVSILRKHGLY